MIMPKRPTAPAKHNVMSDDETARALSPKKIRRKKPEREGETNATTTRGKIV